ncbi:MAG: hypothetical protein ACWGON_06085 [Gemmatimonadota bacterium]
MNRITGALAALVLALALLPAGVQAQTTLAGDWDVAVAVMGQTIPLVLHITEGDEGYSGKFDSPAQGGFDIPIISITSEHPDFTIEPETGGPTAILSGKHEGDTMTGEFSQATATGTFDGTRKAEEEEAEPEGT